ncbi:MAG: phosphatase PAP2 family protein [Opitutaceae bacterium]|jgi:membrane-associated phospholipid phosphatase|nr:phosphatase PAP2 family protein [Opitutaceae bacterium]
MKKRLMAPVFAALFLAISLFAEGLPPRFLLTASDDILAQIPPPPADDSLAGMADIETVLQVQKTRTPEQIARAERVSSQEVMSPGVLVFGPEFTGANLPRTAAVLQQAYDEHRPSVLASKEQWSRARPYNRGLGITPCVEIVPKDGSYPSGHTAESALLAALFSEALPEYKARFMENVRETMWGRVIAGVHFPTDTQAGRLIGFVIAREMLKNQGTQDAIKEMRAEILAFLKKQREIAAGAAIATAAEIARRPVTRSVRMHSHNDYRRKLPFYQAYSQQADSIEADVYSTPVPGELRVAHEKTELAAAPTLDEAYIRPLVEVFRQNNGRPWKGSEKQLVLLVDLKTPDSDTLGRLASKLKEYPDVFSRGVNPRAVRVVVTNTARLTGYFGDYPGLLSFDGEHTEYTPEQLKNIHMISYNFRKLSRWKGKTPLPEEDRLRLGKVIGDVHALGKPVRFWGAPDNETAWKLFFELGVDFINTDKPEACAAWLRK